jgi:hypothetical protein
LSQRVIFRQETTSRTELTPWRWTTLRCLTRNGHQGRLADHLTRMDFIILDELGYLPFAQAGGQLLFHLVSRLTCSVIGEPSNQSGSTRVRI